MLAKLLAFRDSCVVHLWTRQKGKLSACKLYYGCTPSAGRMNDHCFCIRSRVGLALRFRLNRQTAI